MPQQTDLNVSPYFDDFDDGKNYYKVLFKPGYPVQARELTTLQTILQNQIEKFGNHLFVDGSVVIPGQLNYNANFYSVQIENTFSGTPLSPYLQSLEGKIIRGSESGIRAKVVKTLDYTESSTNNITLFLNYLGTNIETGQKEFSNAESLIVEETITTSNSNSFISAETSFSNTISENATSVGSAVILSSGVYFVRGYFINVEDETLILDAYSNTPSYKVGFNIIEDIVNSFEDESLTDNAQGFNNYAASGADRFRIKLELSKKNLDDIDNENFIELIRVENGTLIKNVVNPQYNVIKDELARRTYDESGDYYVRPFNISAKETLNNLKGNNGVFFDEQRTYNNNTPSDDLGTYKVSPGKAYIRGYEVETISPTYLDFEKTRSSKEIKNETFNYVTGPTLKLNRVYGSPIVGINTDYTISLRDSRVGSSAISSTGKEIGLARVYDFTLETGGYTSSTNLDLNNWNISLFDIQTYTEISFSVPTTLSVPTYIKGKSSGATGYLRYPITNAGIATFYNIDGNFSSGEKFIFNGTEDLSRVATAVTAYGVNDVKSLYGIVGSAYTFTADVIPSTNYPVGLVSITASSSGISTVSSTNLRFTGIATVGNLISYSTPGFTVPSFAVINSVGERTLGISSVTSVTGICNGLLPTSSIAPSDFAILSSKFLPSTDNTLYTVFPKSNISSIDLTNSKLTVRRQFDVTISNYETSPISCNTNEKFLNYDESRYVLIREDGVIEPLSIDKVKISTTSNPEVLTIVGLSTSTSTRAKLITTLERSNVKSKVKNKNRVKTLIVNKSSLAQSGIGTTTLNDGLSYGLYPFGTRVQDEEICLLSPDVTKIYGIFESNDTSNPDLPSIIFESIQSTNSSTSDLIIGEEFVGKDSQAVGKFVENPNASTASFVYLNNTKFNVGEEVEFKESGVYATVSSLSNGDTDITKNFDLENGQRNTIYDFSRIVRRSNTGSPIRKIKVVFEQAEILSSDNGDLITKNSYDSFDYSEISSINGTRNSDILDIRPSVSSYTVAENTRSPFEFLGRSFTASSSIIPNILASNESILLDYSFYLPRIDRIYVSKNGVFQISKGAPSETPELPKSLDDAIEIATAYLPAYVFDIEDIKFNILQHKRYTMKDINKLETRIENLEYYTTLSLLEEKTSNLSIKDSQGLDRFKSGFFVDDFQTTRNQKKTTEVKNSIHVENSELRPSHYTNTVDLSFGDFESTSADLNFNPSIQGANVKKTGSIITLNYSDDELVSNPYATRVENVTPYLVTFYSGTIELTPSSDTWVSTVRLNAQTFTAENYVETKTQLSKQDFDEQSGFGQVTWNSWNTSWTGNVVTSSAPTTITRGNQIISQRSITTTQTGVSTRTGTSSRLVRDVAGNISLGDRVLNSSIVPLMRSRNVEIIGKRFKPYTRLYSFFDGVNVSQFTFPKLLEISMVSGTFRVGETVLGSMDNGGENSAEIRFRVAQINHKEGAYNSPTVTYNKSPYSSSLSLSSTYSSTSTILNIDLFSLSTQASGNFYGWVSSGMRLVGQTSGAVATISNVRIVTDEFGYFAGSFFIPNPNLGLYPVFESGTKVFKLTSNSTNNIIEGIADTSAEEKYFSQGKIETVQETIISVRNVRLETATITESLTVTGTPTTVVEEQVIGTVEPPRPTPPPRRPDPLAQSFFVNNPTGIFITKLDLYFQSKDNALPVTVQLRSMSLGTPTSTVYPFGEVVINPSDVNISEDASAVTTVTFPSPIFLTGDQEHAIVLLSNSTEYKVWISRLGEVDRTLVSSSGSQQKVVDKQPTLGSLFKSQNGSTWTPSQYDDLKFKLYNAVFINNGTINFYNPQLLKGNNQIAKLVANPLEVSSRKLRVGIGTTISDVNLTVGNTIIQENSNASATYVGSAGSATGTLLVSNPGIGYTPINTSLTYNDISLTSLTGSGRNAKANIHIVNGVAIAATISQGGVGYQIGDVLSFTELSTDSPGRNAQFTVQSITGKNELIVDNVQGDFAVGSGYTVRYINNSGISTDLNGTGANVLLIDPPQVITDGLHIKVKHKNHGMYSDLNTVVLSGISPDVKSTTITSSTSGTNDFNIADTSIGDFTTFENVSVSSTNPGYALIKNEIISYTGVSAGVPGRLTGITRSIDQTNVIGLDYSVGTVITKYEFNGVSLRRINKQHDLIDVDTSAITNPIGLDYYHVKIDPSTSGVDRSVGTSFPKLYFNSTKNGGSTQVYATQNIPFESITPIVQTTTVSGTDITAAVRTVSGKSIDGSEVSFRDQGFEDINLNSTNYFTSPRIVCSQVNENAKLTTLPNKKSFTLRLNLTTSNTLLSPVIDLHRVAMVFTSNRVNAPIENYITDSRVATLEDDPTAFVYATEVISLENPASSLKIITTAHVNTYSDVRAFYATLNDPSDKLIYYPFPGYSNRLISGEVININESDGTPDKFVPKTDKIGFDSFNIDFRDYEFTIDNLSPFRYYSIKLIGTSTNQAYPPRYRDLRVIALA